MQKNLIFLKIPTCTDEYQNLPNHTMCLVDTPNLNVSGVSESEQQEIVRLHNDFRGSVLPEASDIFAMVRKLFCQCSKLSERKSVSILRSKTLSY